MSILELKGKRDKALKPCLNYMLAGGLTLIESLQLILDKVPVKQLKKINNKLIKELRAYDELD